MKFINFKSNFNNLGEVRRKVEITKIVSDEFIERTLDISVDYSELCLDAFLEDNILKQIPIVKSVLSFYNIGSSLKERHNVKKILTFFHQLHVKEINQEKYESFKNRFKLDKNYQNKVVETVVLYNEKFLQVEKSKILANLIASYIDEDLSWEELQDILVVLENMHPKGFIFLEKMSKEQYWSNHDRNQYEEPFMFACGIGHRHGSKFTINTLGRKFYEFGIRPLNKSTF